MMLEATAVHFLLRTYDDLPHFERRANGMVDSRSWSHDGKYVSVCFVLVIPPLDESGVAGFCALPLAWDFRMVGRGS